MINYTDLMGVSYEEPREYTINNIAFHEPTSRRVRDEKKGRTILFKAKHFLENNCIVQRSATEWGCLPIQDYNKKTYSIRLTTDGFTCECQGFNKKLEDFDGGKSEVVPICSHILAVKQYCFIKEKNKIKKQIS